MLSSLRLRFFQCYRDVELLLSPFVNVVVGTSDSGKSSLLRALELVTFNRPSGKAFRSWFATKDEDTSVLVRTSEGRAVERVRGHTANHYQCDGGDPLKALQLRVPDEVSAALGIGPLNVQRQHDRYYMLQDTAGEVARKFNEIAGLEEIDEAITRLNRLENQTKVQLTETRKQIAETEEQLEQFEDLPAVESLVAEMEQEITGLNGAIADMLFLEDAVKTVKDRQVRIADLDHWLEVEPRYEELKAEVVELARAVDDSYELQSGISRVRSFQVQAAECDKILRADSTAQKLITEIIDLRAAEQEHKELRNAILAAMSAVATREGEDARLKALTQQFEDLVRGMGRCPFCLTEIDEGTIEHILEHL